MLKRIEAILLLAEKNKASINRYFSITHNGEYDTLNCVFSVVDEKTDKNKMLVIKEYLNTHEPYVSQD